MTKKTVKQAEENLKEKDIPVNYMTLMRELGKDKERAEEVATHEHEKKQKGGGK